MDKPEVVAIKRRAFVSSVIEGFRDMREAARRGVIAGGLEPVLVEDFPSLHDSPRNACLDGVDSCDVFISIVGERGGSRTPAGKLVVEEELERAREKGLLVLVFLQDTPRDPEAKQFADRLSDYVGGYLRSTFRTATDLENEVKAATSKYGAKMEGGSIGSDAIIHDLRDPRMHGQDPSIRFALAPVRSEEIIELVRLEEQSFQEDVYRLAHERGRRPFQLRGTKGEEEYRAGHSLFAITRCGCGEASSRCPS